MVRSWVYCQLVKCAGALISKVPSFLRTVRSAVFWTRMLSCPLCNDTLWLRQCEYCLETTQLQFLDMFVMPVVMQRQVPGFLRTVHRCSSWLRSCPTRRRYPWRLTGAVLGPVVYARCYADTYGDSTGAVLGPVVHARCYAETCGDSTGAVLGQVCARCYADTCGDSTGAILGPVVHARCYVDICGDSTGAVLGPVCGRCYADTCGDSRGAVLGKVVDTPVVYNDMGHGPVQFLEKVVAMPVFGRCSFSARTLTRPLCSMTGVMVQTVQFWTRLLTCPLQCNDTCPWRSRQCSSRRPVGSPWRFHRRSSRAWCRVHTALGPVFMPVVMPTPVEIPQVQCTTGAQIQLDRFQQFQLVF